MTYVMDEYDIRELHPPRNRLDKIKEILQNEDDESKRWDCVWLAGEMWDNVTGPVRKEIAELMVWILDCDTNGIVKHEAAFQIGLHNMRDKIPDLIRCAMHDDSDIARHEAIEALGLMRAFESKEEIEKMCKSKNQSVRDTAIFVTKRLERLKNKGSYRDGEQI